MAEETVIGHHFPGQEPATGSLRLNPLDEQTGTIAFGPGEAFGLVFFRVTRPKDEIESFFSRPDERLALHLSVRDQRQKVWGATQDLHALARESHITRPQVPSGETQRKGIVNREGARANLKNDKFRGLDVGVENAGDLHDEGSTYE